MTESSEDYASGRKTSRHRPPAFLQTLWPWVIELWIAAVLATFFIVRILGSNTGKRILDSLRHSLN